MNLKLNPLGRRYRGLLFLLLGLFLRNIWDGYHVEQQDHAPVSQVSTLRQVPEVQLDYAWGSAIHRFHNHPQVLDTVAKPLPWRDPDWKADAPSTDNSSSVVRVWIVTQELSGLHQNGGIGTAYLQLAKALAGQSRLQVSILLAQHEDHFGAVRKSQFTEELSTLGIALHFLPEETVSLAPDLWAAKTSIGIYRFLKGHQNKMDIVHFHDNNGLGYYSALARFEGIALQHSSIVVGLHGPEIEWAAVLNGRLPESDMSLASGYLERRATELADVVVSPSHYMLSYLTKRGWVLPNHRFVIPNLSDLDLHSITFDSYGFEPVQELVYFGRLEERKGIRLFFEGLDLMLEANPEFPIQNITLLGRDRTDAKSGLAVSSLATEAFEALESKYKIDVRFDMLTNLNQHDALHYLSRPGRIAIMPSLADNSPGTVLECIVHGIPFLSSNVGGTSELIHEEDRDTVLFLPTAKALAEKVAVALQNTRNSRLVRPSSEVLQAESDFQQLHFWLSGALPTDKIEYSPYVMNPLVSVIVSHFQRPKLLGHLLQSLIRQTYGNLEVIVIDDGSTDSGTLDALEEYNDNILRPRNWQLLQIPNSYLGEARDYGASTAQGEYLLFLDDDDVLFTEAVNQLVQVAHKTDAGALSSFLAKFSGSEDPYASGTVLSRRQDYWFLGQAVGVGLTTNMFGSGNIFVRKDDFHAVNGFSTYRNLGSEDWEFFMKLALKGITHYVVPEPLLLVREDAARQSMKFTMDQDLSAYRANTPLLGDSHIHALDLSNVLLMARNLHTISHSASESLVSSLGDFRLSQGWNGWYYSFQWATDDIQLLENGQSAEVVDGRWNWPGANYTKPYITELEQHPFITETGESLAAVRSFRNPSFFEGILQVEYTAHHPCGDGTELAVMIQRASADSESEALWTQKTLEDGDGFFTEEVTLDINDVVHLVVYPLESDECDLVRWQMRLFVPGQDASNSWVPITQDTTDKVTTQTAYIGDLKLVEEAEESRLPLVEVALIFDENRLSYARQVVRSIMQMTDDAEYVFHIIAPTELHAVVTTTFPKRGLRLQLYDYALCSTLASPVLPFSSTEIHLSAHCKLFLPSILSSETTKVLFLDNDVTVLDSLSNCWSFTDNSAIIGMSIDMGDICQAKPQYCWPMAAEWDLPYHEGRESVQVNGGVMLLNLKRMRETDFTRRYIQGVAQTYATTATIARFGEQDFINAHFRLFPQDLEWLTCECNYQYRGNSRQTKCSGKDVKIAHGWMSGASYTALSHYQNVFEYFHEDANEGENWSEPPHFSPVSSISARAGDPNTIRMHRNCPHQDWDCNRGFQPVPYGEQAFLLTSTTSADEWSTMQESIESQRYPHIRNILATSIPDVPHANTSLVHVQPTDDLVESINLCAECGHLSSDRSCQVPVNPEDAASVDAYYNCACSVKSTADAFYHRLLSQVKHPGWIVYLPKGYQLRSPNSLAQLMAMPQSHEEIILFSTGEAEGPTSMKTFKPQDVESLGLMHHSSNMWHSRWDTGYRCGKWRTLESFARSFPVRWVDELPLIKKEHV